MFPSRFLYVRRPTFTPARPPAPYPLLAPGLRGKNKSHALCKRCGERAYHIQKQTCASCGFPAARMRKFNWAAKAKRRRTTRTGRLRHLRHMARKAKNHFREGTQATKKTTA